jgi:hypothetical protein
LHGWPGPGFSSFVADGMVSWAILSRGRVCRDASLTRKKAFTTINS